MKYHIKDFPKISVEIEVFKEFILLGKNIKKFPMVECVVKSPFGINSIQETIVDEYVHALFEPFMVNGRR